MSYTKLTDFASKDALLTGNPSKLIRGTELGAEFDAIVVADALNIKPDTVTAATSKTTPVDADLLTLFDSASTFSLKKLTWANLKATIKTYFDTLYAASGGSALVGYIAAGTGAVATTVQAKLRQVVNADDFGAAGDGVTNDTQEVQAAIDAVYAAGGGTVEFSRKDYYLATPVNLKTGVSLKGVGGGITGVAGSILRGPGTGNILQYVGTFGAESRLSIEISGFYFTGCQYAINLLGVANVDIHHNTFGYIRGSASYSAILLENGILVNIVENFFFYCACAVRGDAGMNYHNVIARNDITIDDCAGLSSYKVFGILMRCDTTNVGFGPLNIRDNNFIKVSGGGTTSGCYGLYVAARGQNLNVTGNTFEAITHNHVFIDSVDPITAADHASDVTGMYVACGEIAGNYFIDGADNGTSRCVQMNYGSGFEVSNNYFMPQATVTGRSMVFFNITTYANQFSGSNRFNYRSGYTGVGVEDSDGGYGKNVIWDSTFIDKATDGPNVLTLKNGTVFKLEPNSEYAPRLSQFVTTDEGCEWYSSVSHRRMLVTQDGSAVVHARYSLETPPRYIAGLTATLTLNPADTTIRVASNVANLATINTAYYDGQLLRIINIGAALTIAETGNIRVNGGATLVLATNEGATFIWSVNDTLWIQV